MCVHCFLIIASAATLINIRNARKHFEKLERESQSGLARASYETADAWPRQ